MDLKLFTIEMVNKICLKAYRPRIFLIFHELF